jgi:hypothetical protein
VRPNLPHANRVARPRHLRRFTKSTLHTADAAHRLSRVVAVSAAATVLLAACSADSGSAFLTPAADRYPAKYIGFVCGSRGVGGARPFEARARRLERTLFVPIA